MENILVTGASGFIGHHLAKELISEGNRVYTIAREGKVRLKDCESIKGDLTQKQTLILPENLDVVYHCAGLTNSHFHGKKAYKEFLKVNYYGTLNLLQSIVSPIRKFIYFSSVDAVGKVENELLDEKSDYFAESPYDYSKMRSELYLLNYERKSSPVVIVRPSMVYGEGELSEFMKINTAVLKICQMVKKRFFPIIGSGQNNLPLVHVNDIVNGAILSSSKGKNGEIYILSGQRSYTLIELVKTIADIQGIDFPIIHYPKNFIRSVISYSSKVSTSMGFNFPLSESSIDYLSSNRLFNIDKAKSDLGYRPMNLKEGMKSTINWFENRGYL